MPRPADPAILYRRDLAKRLGMTESQLAAAKKAGRPLPRPVVETPTRSLYYATHVERWEKAERDLSRSS